MVKLDRTSELIKTCMRGLTPKIAIVSFQYIGDKIHGKIRYQINGFGYPLIAEATFRADLNGKILEIKGIGF